MKFFTVAMGVSLQKATHARGYGPRTGATLRPVSRMSCRAARAPYVLRLFTKSTSARSFAGSFALFG